MRLVIIGGNFPPLRSSAAVQLYDLSQELAHQAHDVTVLLPDSSCRGAFAEEYMGPVRVLRLKSPQTNNVGYARRTISEYLMPYAMCWNLKRSPLKEADWDGIIWYSPSIFYTPLVAALKRRTSAKAYLIIRDIFPEWALDLGLMQRGPIYWIFKWLAQKQFKVADIIGVQTHGNLAYFKAQIQKQPKSVEVLQNWLGPASNVPCSVQVDQTSLAGRKIIVYAGNMGVAQGLDIVFALIERMQARSDVGFLFVGRGSELARLRKFTQDQSLTNVVFMDEINSDEIPNLYRQCFGGLVSLDHRHKSHNIPGKFLTYMQAGLPVFAKLNPGNDLIDIIHEQAVGQACDTEDLDEMERRLTSFLNQDKSNEYRAMSEACKNLFKDRFAVGKIAHQILTRLNNP